MFEVRQKVHDVYDLTNLLFAYASYEEEDLMDRIPDYPVHQICQAMQAHGIVSSAATLESNAIVAAQGTMYNPSRAGFVPVRRILNICDYTIEGVEELAFVVAVTAMDNPEYWEELLRTVERYIEELIDEDDGGYDENRWLHCWRYWDNTKKDAMKTRMYNRFGIKINC